jgi:hypothetical protein
MTHAGTPEFAGSLSAPLPSHAPKAPFPARPGTSWRALTHVREFVGSRL